MSRRLEILRKAKLDAELFARPVEREIELPFRASLDKSNGHDQWQQLVHELFLRREPAGCCAVGLASATAGEGTSYVASHLAAELARSTEQPSLLLEANVYRPSQAEEHGVEPNPGLRRILLDKGFPIDACLHQTAVEHLWVMPAGSAFNGAGGAPEWTQFPRAFEWLRGRFAGIVVDLPPVNLSTDALIAGPLLDGVVLIVAADLCSREVIQNAVTRLRRANPSVLGTILNKRKFVIPEPIYRRL